MTYWQEVAQYLLVFNTLILFFLIVSLVICLLSFIYLFIHLFEMYCNDDSYHNCRYFFQKSNQSEDMEICMNYRWNLRINAIQTIKFGFILGIKNPRQLAYIIVNINLSIIFFSSLLLYTKFWRVFNFSFDCSPFDVVHFVHRVSNVFWFYRILFFPIPMSTAHRIFQYCYWFSMSNKLKGNKKIESWFYTCSD